MGFSQVVWSLYAIEKKLCMLGNLVILHQTYVKLQNRSLYLGCGPSLTKVEATVLSDPELLKNGLRTMNVRNYTDLHDKNQPRVREEKECSLFSLSLCII